jgi:hypothetical protein
MLPTVARLFARTQAPVRFARATATAHGATGLRGFTTCINGSSSSVGSRAMLSGNTATPRFPSANRHFARRGMTSLVTPPLAEVSIDAVEQLAGLRPGAPFPGVTTHLIDVREEHEFQEVCCCDSYCSHSHCPCVHVLTLSLSLSLRAPSRMRRISHVGLARLFRLLFIGVSVLANN